MPDEAHDMQKMEQLLTPVHPPPLSFENRLSRLKAWTLIPTFCGPMLAWAIVKHWLVVSTDVSLQVRDAITYAALLIWWLVQASPRPHSIRATMGRPLHRTGSGQMPVALLGLFCLSWIDLLSVNFRDLWRATSSGGTSTIHLTSADPARLWRSFS
jgi:hypothetical protein